MRIRNLPYRFLGCGELKLSRSGEIVEKKNDKEQKKAEITGIHRVTGSEIKTYKVGYVFSLIIWRTM